MFLVKGEKNTEVVQDQSNSAEDCGCGCGGSCGKKKTWLWIGAAIVLLAAGAWWYFRAKKSA